MTAPVLTDGVVVLRVLDVSDAGAWQAGEDAEQIRWFEAPGPAPLENIIAAINNWRAEWERNGARRHFGIWTGNRLCGGIELRVRHDGRANLSYLVFPEARRNGVARRSLQLATRWTFDHLAVPTVVAIIDEDNVASVAVATACGFTLEGVAEAWEHSESGVMLRYVLPAG